MCVRVETSRATYGWTKKLPPPPQAANETARTAFAEYFLAAGEPRADADAARRVQNLRTWYAAVECMASTPIADLLVHGDVVVRMCEVSGAVPRPADVQPGTEDDALFVAQAMPWIDPLKEAEAWVALVRAGFASEVEAIRKRGASPRDVVEQIRAFRADAGDLVFTADARVPITTGQQAPSATPQEPGAQ